MSHTTTPPWASESCSKSLPVLRDSGESGHLEFKEIFPLNGRDLAKEIAAFATSQGGTILVGVGDKGELIGLPEATTAEGRDVLLTRLAGICKSNVNPSLSPSVEWGIEDEKIVLAINVPEGTQPVYYAGNVPYVRFLSTSRPAEPHEVEELIIEHHTLTPASMSAGKENDETPPWVVSLVHVLLPVLIFSDEAEKRMIDPWLSIWRSQFKQAAEQLREMVAENSFPAGLDVEVKALAKLLDDVAVFRIYIGSGPSLLALVKQVSELAENIWTLTVGPYQAAFGGESSVAAIVEKSANRLGDLGERANEMLFGGRSDEFLNTVASIGATLIQGAILYLKGTNAEKFALLRDIGRDLHLIETKRLYLDGGQSQENLVAYVDSVRTRLSQFAHGQL